MIFHFFLIYYYKFKNCFFYLISLHSIVKIKIFNNMIALFYYFIFLYYNYAKFNNFI